MNSVIVAPEDFINQLKDSLVSELRDQLSQTKGKDDSIEYLSSKEVCDLLKIDLSTLYKWRKESKIPSYGIGNRVFFKRHEIDQIINKNKLS